MGCKFVRDIFQTPFESFRPIIINVSLSSLDHLCVEVPSVAITRFEPLYFGFLCPIVFLLFIFKLKLILNTSNCVCIPQKRVILEVLQLIVQLMMRALAFLCEFLFHWTSVCLQTFILEKNFELLGAYEMRSLSLSNLCFCFSIVHPSTI